MTKEEARLTLQENFGYLTNEHPRIVEALRVALEVLNDEVAKPHWISVKVRKPEIKHSEDNMQYSDAVLVTNGEYRTSACWMHNKWAGWYGWYDGDDELGDITHWMPMPEPPMNQEPKKGL